MKNIKTYSQLFESQQELTQEQSEWLDKCTDGTWKISPQTGLVDVDGHFDCRNQGLTDFKGVRFGNVSRCFYCFENKLTSLEGAPQRVGEYFNCSSNELESLKGCPKYVGGGFDCYKNELKSLKDAPDYVGQHFDCSFNKLTSLEGAPNRVNGYFQCSYNRLKSLKYAPEYVKKDFNCSNNRLTSLEGAPQHVGEGFHFSENRITSLEGLPQRARGDFSDNPISDRAIRGVLERMGAKKISLEQAVAEYWKWISQEDRAYLAKHHPNLSPEDKRIYMAIELNMKRR